MRPVLTLYRTESTNECEGFQNFVNIFRYLCYFREGRYIVDARRSDVVSSDVAAVRREVLSAVKVVYLWLFGNTNYTC